VLNSIGGDNTLDFRRSGSAWKLIVCISSKDIELVSAPLLKKIEAVSKLNELMEQMGKEQKALSKNLRTAIDAANKFLLQLPVKGSSQ